MTSLSSSANRVQLYMERHKISDIFDQLMKSIVKDLPLDPVAHLVHVLKSIQRPEAAAPVALPKPSRNPSKSGTMPQSKASRDLVRHSTTSSPARSLQSSSVKVGHVKDLPKGGKIQTGSKSRIADKPKTVQTLVVPNNFDQAEVAEENEEQFLEREFDPLKFRKDLSEVSSPEPVESAKILTSHHSKKLSLKLQKEQHKKDLLESVVQSPEKEVETIGSSDDENAESGLEEDYSDLIADGIVPRAASKPSRAKKQWAQFQPAADQSDPVVEEVKISVCSRCATVIEQLSQGPERPEEKSRSPGVSRQSSDEKNQEADESGLDVGFKWKFASNDSDSESVTNFLTRKQQLFKTSDLFLESHRDSSRQQSSHGVKAEGKGPDIKPKASKGWVGSHFSSSDEDF